MYRVPGTGICLWACRGWRRGDRETQARGRSDSGHAALAADLVDGAAPVVVIQSR